MFLGDAGAHQPERGELREDVAGEAVLAIPLARVGDDLREREVARQLLDLALFRRELEVHRARVIPAAAGPSLDVREPTMNRAQPRLGVAERLHDVRVELLLRL